MAAPILPTDATLLQLMEQGMTLEQAKAQLAQQGAQRDANTAQLQSNVAGQEKLGPPLPLAQQGLGGPSMSSTSLMAPPTTQGSSPMGKEAVGAFGGLAALPLAIGATQVRGIENGPNPAITGLNAQTAANTQSALAMSNANPNVNPALQQRNASEALMRANLQAGAGAMSAIQQREIEQQQAKQQRIQAGMAAAGQAISVGTTAASFMSDERTKTNVQDGSGGVQQAMRALAPVTFDQPATGIQGQTGVMAQNLAATPVGAQTLAQPPTATQPAMVDTNAATQLSLAGIGDLQAQVDQLRQSVGGSVNELVQNSASPGVPAAPMPAQAALQALPQQVAQAAQPPIQQMVADSASPGVPAPAPQAQAPSPAPAPQAAPPTTSAPVAPTGGSTAREILENALRETNDAIKDTGLGQLPVAQNDTQAPRNGATIQPDVMEQFMNWLREKGLVPEPPIPDTRQGVEPLRGSGLVPSVGKGGYPKA